MAAKLPSDLTPKWWSTNKAKTLKSTGFGEALKSFEKAEAEFAQLKSHSQAAFKSIFGSIDALLKAREKAEKACVAKLHDDTKAALKKYQSLILEVGKKYTAKNSRYQAAMESMTESSNESVKTLREIIKNVEAVTKNCDGLEKIANILKVKPDNVKTQEALKLAQDFSGRIDKAENKLKQVAQELDNKVKHCGLDSADLITIGSVKVFGNASSHFLEITLPEARKRHRQVVAALNATQ